MKVLYVYATLRQRNGVTAVIMNYLRHMPKEGLQIDLLVYSDSEPDMVSLAESLGTKVFFMPKLGLKSFRRFSSFLDAFFTDHPYDIVHSHFNQVDFALFPAARRHGVRHCISHSHNTKLSDYPLRAVRNRLLCWNIARNADTLAACSEAAGEALFGKVFSSDPRKLVVRNGVDIPRFSFDGQARHAIRDEFRVAPDEILLGHVGSFRPQKNHAFMLRLLNRLLKHSDRFKLCFVGNGGLWEHIRETAENMSLSDKVVFAGSRPDVPKILSAFDIFLLPSLFEGFGISLVEAQISGLPCLASSRVPREVAFTDMVRFLPLGRNGSPWVDAVLDIRPGERTSHAAEAFAAGYDIAAAAESLAEFYRRKAVSP